MSLPLHIEKPDYFSLGIDDFSICVKCSHSSLVEILNSRYADFPPRRTPSFTANVKWVGKERQSSLLDTKTTFQDGVLHFSATGYRGFIDERNGKGFLELSSAQPVEDIDYFLRIVLALIVHQAGGILMHTAGIIRNGKAYLFFGHSGSGKTTVCRFSTDKYIILNDDLVLLVPQGERWLAHGTPFWNPTQIKPNNMHAPVAGLYFLIQDSQVFVKELTSGKAIAAILANIPVIPQDTIRSIQLLEIVNHFQKHSPVFELHFLPDNSFWDVIT